jgi:AcrR family transcriptional regulator
MTTRSDVTTRTRLLDAAMRLFARQGVAGTTVGQIEAEAGMAARSGALYKYFESKASLLTAGLERHLENIDDMSNELASRQLGDLRVELALVGHWLLAELEVERDITHIVEREGVAHPELRARVRDGISERGYRIAADFIARWRPDLIEPERNALAVVALGALINFRRSHWTFGAPPLNLDEAQLLRGWVDVCATFLAGDAGGGGGDPKVNRLG